MWSVRPSDHVMPSSICKHKYKCIVHPPGEEFPKQTPHNQIRQRKVEEVQQSCY